MSAGVWLVSTAAATAVVATFVLRGRTRSEIVTLALAAAGAGIGWGAMLLQPNPSSGEFVAAVAMLAFLVPAHARIVLGPFGPAR